MPYPPPGPPLPRRRHLRPPRVCVRVDLHAAPHHTDRTVPALPQAEVEGAGRDTRGWVRAGKHGTTGLDWAKCWVGGGTEIHAWVGWVQAGGGGRWTPPRDHGVAGASRRRAAARGVGLHGGRTRGTCGRGVEGSATQPPGGSLCPGGTTHTVHHAGSQLAVACRKGQGTAPAWPCVQHRAVVSGGGSAGEGVTGALTTMQGMRGGAMGWNALCVRA